MVDIQQSAEERKMLILAAVVMGISAYIYSIKKEKQKKRGLAYKAFATLIGFALMASAAVHARTWQMFFLSLGILLYACADVALEINFQTGLICFGMGHISMIIGMCKIVRPRMITAVLLAGMYFVLYCVFRKYFRRLRKLKIPALIYVFFLCSMSAMMLTLAVYFKDAVYAAGAAGSICFVISDAMIGWRTVRGKTTRQFGNMILLLYYAAVYLLSAAFYIKGM